MRAGTQTLALLAALLTGAASAQNTSPASETQAPAEKPAAADDNSRIQVTGRRDAVEQRRISTAAKIVISREEIEQFGDATLADVIKRLPSVTVGGRPGRGGQIRMRGMGGGYTQILIDGERMPPGFSIDQIAPDQIERIEILRAPTAETGARAIAGTINIVLREPLRQRGDDLRIGVADERGGLQPNISYTRNDVLGEGGTWTVNLSANHADLHTDTASATSYVDMASGAPVLLQGRQGRQHDRRDSLHLNGRVQWQLGGGDNLMLQPFFVVNQNAGHNDGVLTQTLGSDPAPYARSASDSRNRSTIARLMLQLRKRLSDSTRLELRGNVGTFRSSSNSLLEQDDEAGTLVLDQATASRVRDRSWSLSGKLSQTLLDAHSLVAGLEGEGVRRFENTLTRVKGKPTLDDFDGDLTASTQRIAAWLQDEWDPAPAWSAYAGLRWETIRTRSDSIGAPVANTGTVLAPLAHAVWRFNAPARDQLRISLTRSYKAPTLGNLTALPRISTLYPASGPNTASAADRAGNPALRPELARGLDLALEHYLPGGGVMSLSAFRRQIHDLIRNVTAEEELVPWSGARRWVNRPQNIGDARVVGIEIDAKFRPEELAAGTLPGLSLRGNLGLYRSQVSGIRGPDNRIDQQPKQSLNLGADYKLRGLPLTVGANLNRVPGYRVQQSDIQALSLETTRVFDAFALWTFNPATRLRLNLSNVVPRNYVTGSSIVANGQLQTSVSNGPTYRVVGLRLELKL